MLQYHRANLLAHHALILGPWCHEEVPLFISKDLRIVKLRQLMKLEGYANMEQLMEAATFDVVTPAICIQPECVYTGDMEPDQDGGFCEACGHQTVVSALVLAQVI